MIIKEIVFTKIFILHARLICVFHVEIDIEWIDILIVILSSKRLKIECVSKKISRGAKNVVRARPWS